MDGEQCVFRWLVREEEVRGVSLSLVKERVNSYFCGKAVAATLE